MVGNSVGADEIVGAAVEGWFVGLSVVGLAVVGCNDGLVEGLKVGFTLGVFVGRSEGCELG